jgi:hypothetical protein
MTKHPRTSVGPGGVSVLLQLVVVMTVAVVVSLLGGLLDDSRLGGVRLKPAFGDSAQTMRGRGR